MVERVFLGWDRPFLGLAVAWLAAHREELPDMRVIVPTAQSGRRLREALVEMTGAVLAPQVATPGSFLATPQPGIAQDWAEKLAWMEVLEGISDWSGYAGLFPHPPERTLEWSGGLAGEMVSLRRSLQENGLLLRTAAWKLRDSVEADRWKALADLEARVEKKLTAWKMTSRSQVLENGLEWPAGISRVVLAGVAELPPLLQRELVSRNIHVSVLIGAPEEEADGFSPLGMPVATWTMRPIPWRNVCVAADPRQQAVEAMRVIAETQADSSEIALGSADTETGDELARALTREGWPAFHPAQAARPVSLVRWIRIWNEWLSLPSLAVMADLLAAPETAGLVRGRFHLARRLAELRNQWMVLRTEDLERRVLAQSFRNEMESKSAEEVLAAARALETWRGRFLQEDLPAVMGRLLDLVAVGETAMETVDQLRAWLAEAAPLMARINRPPRFWIELMISELPSPTPLPPEGRIIDVQGWLELFHEPGQHLVLCGMNEGKIPARSGGEPWLGEAARKALGLIKDEDRAARDAFLYRSMLEARTSIGSVHVICGKNGTGGETLLPSRLLLAAERQELPGRVKALFQEIEPPEAGLRWEADWQWKPRSETPPVRISVTSLRDYLECPFRYYLKHVVRMQNSESGRKEWNARDFGTVAHEVLERWGRDPAARNEENPVVIGKWLSSGLDHVVEEWFGKRPPLAVKIQTESLRQRLAWLARVQAAERAAGWEVIDVEREVKIAVGEIAIIAKIDRIDRHRETGALRVLDYKTGKVDGVERSHRKKITTSTHIPEHLPKDSPVFCQTEVKGKPSEMRWVNLQLPLYAAGILETEKSVPVPCYFTLGATESDIAIQEWTEFSMEEIDAAMECTTWLIDRISQGVFWPPAEKITYDDYQLLAAGRDLLTTTLPPQEKVGPVGFEPTTKGL